MSIEPVALNPTPTTEVSLPKRGEAGTVTRAAAPTSHRGPILLAAVGFLAFGVGSYLLLRLQPELFALLSSPALVLARVSDLANKHPDLVAAFVGTGLILVGGVSLVIASLLALFGMASPNRQHVGSPDSLGI